MALAVFSGSSGSAGGGVRAVLTAQKRQPRVQMSPSSMMVAVPVSPFQHSPMLGHCASSHTVCRFSVRRLSLRYSYLGGGAGRVVWGSKTEPQKNKKR